MRTITIFFTASIFLFSCMHEEKTGQDVEWYNEPFRPQIHFTPKAHWMNDPNGLVHYKGTYHLFYQYYPDSTVWGPVHWGHATGSDLFHWKHEPVALYPDSLGYIFSGSAVVDENNSTGFGADGRVPMVAIFTHHNARGEKEGRKDYQSQSLAYSLDEGETWSKYSGNPVLKNPGTKDFRDPKVSRNEQAERWIMSLATGDRISFYSSIDLKNWVKESEFGKGVGAHGGVWECPDLVSFRLDSATVWMLIVNLNPGGPNGGSATQYFVGDFDGHQFTPYDTITRWLDYGPDEYAGVTYANTGDRKIFLGWMSNWQYGARVPTKNWRSAMTIPRELSIEKIGNQYYVASVPAGELNELAEPPLMLEDIDAGNYDLTDATGPLEGPARLMLNSNTAESFTLTMSNDKGERLLIGYDKPSNRYFIDRTKSGIVAFEKGFGRRHWAPRLSKKQNLSLDLVIDATSVELFADAGFTVMTEIFFPTKPYSKISIQSAGAFVLDSIQFNKLRSVY